MAENTTAYSSYAENFRQEVLSPFFNCIKGAESSYLVGAGSMGKTRLMDYLMLPEVQKNYLDDEANRTILIRMDMNRIHQFSDWGFYELGLTTTIQACGQHSELHALAEQYIKTLLIPLLDKPDPLKALRFWELTVSNICQRGYKLCFILDEFDHAYQTLPAQVFSHLRAMRDMNKINLCYALFLRNLPAVLRPQLENEGFFELISRNPIGIGPYTYRDTKDMLRKLEKRRNHQINMEETRQKIHEISGGHPGTVLAIFSLLIKKGENDSQLYNRGWLLRDENIKDECFKLFESLEKDERVTMTKLAHGILADYSRQVVKVLRLKGLLTGPEDLLPTNFSPIFEMYLQNHVKLE